MSKKATREAFGEALLKTGGSHPNVVVLDADLSKSTKSDAFAKAYPQRFFEMGIAEANMLGTAAGLAMTGHVPFACSFACFITGRYDQIRLSVAYAKANVRIIGTHAGVGIGEDGLSQQGLEDLGLMRGLPGMAVFQPCDDVETEQVIAYLAGTHQGPAYVRLMRQKTERVHDPATFKFEPGKSDVLLDLGTDVGLFASGGTVDGAVEAAKALKAKGIGVTVINVCSIKPFDRAAVIAQAKRCKRLVSAEDHEVIGGLGTCVAEVLAEEGLGVKLHRIGLQDVFGESGTPEELYRHFKLDGAGIAEQVEGFTKS